MPYLGVDRFDEALDRLVHNGATVYRGPLAVDGWRMAQIKDPFGTIVGITDR